MDRTDILLAIYIQVTGSFAEGILIVGTHLRDCFDIMVFEKDHHCTVLQKIIVNALMHELFLKKKES